MARGPVVVMQRAAQRAVGAAMAGLSLLQGALATARPPVAATPVVAPPAPGFEPLNAQPRNQTHLVELLRTYEALFGRTTTNLGPTNPRWTTFTGDMDPESIKSALTQADQGLPYVFCDMSRRAIEQDAHLGGVYAQYCAGIVSREDRIEPPRSMRRDKVAVGLANWLRAVREQIDGFDRARYALLWADGVGYSSAEIIYDRRPITWFDGDNQRITRYYTVPTRLETVEGRAFKFDINTDEPLLWLSNPGDYCTLPPAKFVFHQTFRTSSLIERGGFMRSCIFLHAAKQWALRDMAIYLHLYGLPQLLMEYDPARYKVEDAQRVTRQIQEALGQGGIPTVPAGLTNLRSDTPAPSGALVHRDAAEFLSGEQTKRVTLGPLVMDQGSGYGLGDVHAEGAHDGRILSANGICDTLRRDLWRPTVALNVMDLAADLGAHPIEIACALSAYHARILREDTPSTRQQVFTQAAKDGCPVSKTQYRAELHLDEPKDDEDVIGGEAVSVPSSGAAVSAVEASEGVEAPNPNAPGGKPEALPAKEIS